MANGTKPRSILEQIANIEDLAPKDFDPEDDANKFANTDSNDGDDDIHFTESREHYEDVGESRLRKPNVVNLGPQYKGASISRDALNIEDEDEDDRPFGRDGKPEESGDDDNFDDRNSRLSFLTSTGKDGAQQQAMSPNKGPREPEIVNEREKRSVEADGSDGEHSSLLEEKISSSGGSSKGEGEDEDEDEDDEGLDEDESQDDDTYSNIASPPPDNDRAALRKMMAEERGTFAATLSAAANADIRKGRAIKHQRATFDTLLNTRIKLQKALIATNSMGSLSTTQTSGIDADHAESIKRAEEAALNLWNSLSSLRTSIHPSSAKKRPYSATASSSSSTLWTHTTSLDNLVLPQHRSTLTKWSQRTNPTTALRQQNRFSQLPAQQPLVAILDQQLQGESLVRAVKRTRIARSCAPVQAASSTKSAAENENIYDDADFYTLLLRELVDRRMAASNGQSQSIPTASTNNLSGLLPSRAELKVKKAVDTKASKGRKIRYVVHEKLQNFMAAEDRGVWGERQRAELFGSLLGRRIDLNELDREDVDGDEHFGSEALKLFGR